MSLVLLLIFLITRALTLTLPDNGERTLERLYRDSKKTPLSVMDKSPCHVTTTEQDVIVDCANKNLHNLRPEWFPPNTTNLNLEGNLLDSIPDGIFENCSQLQTLNLNNNKIKTIMPRAFLGLHKLENLYLGMNQLDICDKRFSVSAFEPLDNLKVLDLFQNLPFDKDQYCYGFIGNIVSLTSLSIDTQGKHVYFGEEFRNLTKLEKLRITGDAEIITDDSFKYLQNLRYLSLDTLESLNNISFNFLTPLVNLDQLYIVYCYIGVKNTLSLLHPLAGRNMTTIYLQNVELFQPWLTNEKHFLDGMLDSNTTLSLRQICVSDFTFIHSHLFYLEYGALESETWNQCLQYLDLSRNPWQGNLHAFLVLTRMKNLRSITVNDIIPNNFEFRSLNSVFITASQNSSLNKRLNSLLENTAQFKTSFRRGKDKNQVSWKITESRFLQERNVSNKKNVDILNYNTQHVSKDLTSFILWVSRTLTFISMSGVSNIADLSIDLIFQGAETLNYIDISDSGFHKFTGRIKGLSGLKIFKASGNDMSIISETFFDTFPALEELEVANCGFDINFMFTNGTRLLSNLINLQRLDLSSNSLSMLSQGMFWSNLNLTELNLSGNRFFEIQFSVNNIRKLTSLDIRYNTFTSLPKHITSQMEFLAEKREKFELFLDGNILFCACQNIKFLQWLRLTAVTLDLDGNFTCINEQGVLTYTDAYIDLDGFWRQCWGQFFFYFSLILFSLMTIVFLCAFVINKYRTYIVSQLLGIFFGFRQHLPGDYKIGVFFAYEDLDYQFVTGELIRFVEQRLGMSTYIRHRDLLPGVVLGEAIADAIASCWRTVIIINQDFQDSSEYFQFTCRSAVSMINLANPFRVLVLVTERYRHRIPRDILSAIQEDNIVVVERLEMDGVMQELLRNRLTR